MSKPTVFVHTNPKQLIGAIVSAHSFQRSSANTDRFEVRIICTDEYPFVGAREGQKFLRDGIHRVWRMDDLQSFTPLRFIVPEIMNYEGRAVVVDPDVFAVADIWQLMSRDMRDHAMMCRYRPSHRLFKPGYLSSSVMLLDCAKLRHWRCEEQFNEMFEFKRDYLKWVMLELEPRESIAMFEDEWNDYDHFSERTKIVHNTKRLTQPWKTGLPIDFTLAEYRFGCVPSRYIRQLRRLARGKIGPEKRRYKKHPDPRQESLFFTLLSECVAAGKISLDRIRQEMQLNHIRHDTLEVLEHFT